MSYGDLPDIAAAKPVFDSEGAWKLYEDDKHYYVVLSASYMNPQCYKILVTDKVFARGKIYIAGSASANPNETPALAYPLRYPLDEMLISNLLARSQGVEIHGLGIDYDGKGIIFTGTSGAGKSTLGSLWLKHGHAQILSSDRLIMRGTEPSIDAASTETGIDGPFYLFGTPWHGDGTNAYDGVELKRIAVLKQARRNRMRQIPASEAATALIVRSFPTFWNKESMQSTIDLISRICLTVPCYELEFKPEAAAIETSLEGL